MSAIKRPHAVELGTSHGERIAIQRFAIMCTFAALIFPSVSVQLIHVHVYKLMLTNRPRLTINMLQLSDVPYSISPAGGWGVHLRDVW